MRRTILAVLSLTALLLTSACGSGAPQAKTTPVITAKSTTTKPATATPQGGGSASADVAAARACEAMAVMLDSYEADFGTRLSANINTGLLHDLLNKLHVLGAKPKWAAVAADLAATATEAEATAKPPPPAG
jgi:hypothetical protein